VPEAERTIEGANSLYLPQAKVYAGSCALASGIRLVSEVDPGALAISLTIKRDAAVVWSGRTTTGRLQRPLLDLVGRLFEEEQY
jgi:2-dehydro-3-deoxy-D-arabinonate dehydratase